MTPPAPAGRRDAALAPGGGSAALLETAAEAIEGAEPAVAARSQWRVVARRFSRHKLAMAALVLMLGIAALAALAPVVTRYDVNPTLDAEVVAEARQGPSLDHWFGTDKLGRDQFTRVLYAVRVSLLVGLGTAMASTLVGVAVGAPAGYYGGWVDQTLMRFTDLVLVVPTVAVFLVLSQGRLPVLGVDPGNSIAGMIVILSVLGWMPMARVVRGEFVSMREQEFVEAARASGASSRRIVVRHMLPNVVGPVVVFFTLTVGLAILTESLLSFLGAGIQLPDVSLGNLIDDARGQVGTRLAYLVYFPGLVLFVIVLCVNFVGDGLRDALDPRALR